MDVFLEVSLIKRERKNNEYTIKVFPMFKLLDVVEEAANRAGLKYEVEGSKLVIIGNSSKLEISKAGRYKGRFPKKLYSEMLKVLHEKFVGAIVDMLIGVSDELKLKRDKRGLKAEMLVNHPIVISAEKESCRIYADSRRGRELLEEEFPAIPIKRQGQGVQFLPLVSTVTREFITKTPCDE